MPGSGRTVTDTSTGGVSATLEGTLERITYSNEETGWSVVRLAIPGRRAPVTAVGNLLGVQPGETLHLQGQWVRDRKYGEQFRVESYVTVQPATLVGIEKYLSSPSSHCSFARRS